MARTAACYGARKRVASHDSPMPEAALTAGTAGFDLWIEFIVLVLVLLGFDLFVVHRKAHVVSLREAAGWSVFWITLALGFNAWVGWKFGSVKAAEFLTAYVVEKLLSVDNLFIFVTLFAFFKVPGELRHRVLFYGILGALVMRGLFIWLGSEILHAFEPAFYVFGVILIWSAVKLFGEADPPPPDQTLAYRVARRIFPMVPRYEGERFFVRENGRLVGTTLFLVLLVVEMTDLVFAVDSVPACLAISSDPFIVYSSNVFAILGLRALFFLLEGTLHRVAGLRAGLSLVLVFVGGKMMLVPHGVKLNPWISLGVIAATLVGSWAVATGLRAGERRRGG